MALENILSQEIVQKLGWTLLHFVWQAAAAALLLTILLAVLRKSSANLRYIIACAALGLIVLLPIATMQLVPVSTPQPAANIESAPVPAPVILPVQEFREIQAVEMSIPEGPVQHEITGTAFNASWKQRAADLLEPALPYIVSTWLLGVFGLSIWHLGGWAQLQRLRKKMVRPVNSSLLTELRRLSQRLRVTRAVQLAESALVQVPTVIGWLRPVILLPASALTGLSSEQLEALLAHELAHIRRHDYLINILQTIVETLGFYHPAVWWVSHKIRIERENCCDDLAVSISGDRIRYARALTSMEEIRGRRSELAVAATGGNLFGRIRRLVGKDSTESSRTSWVPSVITILLIAIIAIPTTLALTANDKTPHSAKFLLDKMLEHRSRVRNLQYVAEDNIWRDLAAEQAMIEDQIKSMRESGTPERQLERFRKAFTEAPESRYQILKCTVDDEEHVKIEQTGGNYDSSGKKMPRDDKNIWAWNGVLATDFSQRGEFPGSATIKDAPQVATTLGHPWRSFTGIFCKFLQETIAAEKPVNVEKLEDGSYRVAFDYKTSRIVAVVDPSKGYTCALRENYNEQGQLTTRNTATYEEVAEGIWFPISGQTELYTDDGSVRHKSTAKSSQIRINDPAFNAGYFDVDMPEGTAVRDDVQGKKYVVGSKRVYDLIDPQKTSAEEEQVDPNFWQEKFYSIYRLEDDQVLKRIAPPYIPERTGYFKSVQPGRYSPNTPPHVVSQYFNWDGKLSIRGASVGGRIRRLKSTLESVIGLGNREYDIPSDILSADMSGDWIVRKDTPQEELLQALEKIVKDETARDIDFVKQKVETEVIIAEGKYNFQLLPNITDGQYVLISTNNTDTYTGGGGGSGMLDKFLRWVGNRVGMNVVDETEAEGVELSWRNHDSSELSRLNHDAEPYNQRLDLLLKNLTRQTGLALSRETATVEKWFISENGTIKAPQKSDVEVETDEGRIEGKIIDINIGKGISGVQLTAVPNSSSASNERFACTSAEDGAFAIGGLQSGEYLLQGDFPSVDVDVVSGRCTNDVLIGVRRGETVPALKETTAEQQRGGQILLDVRVIEMPSDTIKEVSEPNESLSSGLFVRHGHEIAGRLLTLTQEREDAKQIANPQVLMLNNGNSAITITNDEKVYTGGYESAEGEPEKLTAQNKYLEAGWKYKFKAEILENGEKVHIELAARQQKPVFETLQYRPGYDYQIPVRPEIFATDIIAKNGEPVVISRLKPGEPAFCLIVTPSALVPEPLPVPLLGKKLPEPDNIQNIDSLKQVEGKRILVCFWDMNQRPSRNIIVELAKRENELKAKGVAVVLVDISQEGPAKLKQWLDSSKIPFACGNIENDADDVLFAWGVLAQPWLILTDKKGIVEAEGFGLEQLDEKLQKNDSYLSIENAGKTISTEQESTNRKTITGVVRDEKGRPLEGVNLILERIRQVFTSDTEGKFEINLDPLRSEEYEYTDYLLARHEKYNLAAIVELDEDVETLDIKLKPGVIISGKVVDPENRAIAGASITLFLQLPMLMSTSIGGVHRQTTDSEGNFELKVMPTGHEYWVQISDYGYRQESSMNIQTDNLSADRRVDIGRIKLPVASLSVSGIVVDANDKPVANADVSILGEHQPDHVTQTDFDGKFIFEKVCDVIVQVFAITPGRITLHGSVGTYGGATDVKIIVTEQGTDRFLPKPPHSLMGNDLHGLIELGISVPPDDLKNRKILLCFWDMEPWSRNSISELAKREKELTEKNVIVLLVHTSGVEPSKLKEWLAEHKIPFICGSIKDNVVDVLFRWGAQTEPWFILTDENGIVRAEGFDIEQLNEKLKVEESIANNSSVPMLAKSVAPSAEDEPVEGPNQADTGAGSVQVLPAVTKAAEGKTHIRVDCRVLEIYSSMTIDRETLIAAENLVGQSVLMPADRGKAVPLRRWPSGKEVSRSWNPTVEEFFREVVGAIRTVPHERFSSVANDAQTTQKMTDLLASRGYMKILMAPTLEVVDGQTARIASEQSGIRDLQVRPKIVDGKIIRLLAEGTIIREFPQQDREQPPSVESASFHTEVGLLPGRSLIMVGMKETQSGAKDLEGPKTDFLFILTPTIVETTKPRDETGVVSTATTKALPRNMITRVYHIADLIGEPADHGGTTRVMQTHNLVQFIQKRVEPESWYDLSDTGKGTITPYPMEEPKKLAIYNTAKSHPAIQQLLEKLRSGVEPMPVESPVGKAAPELKDLGVELKPGDLGGNKTLICFWDMNQRPSRNLVGELAKREKELAEKNVAVYLVHTSNVEPAKLKEWLDNQNIPFTCGSIKNDAEKVLFRWGVRAQPWLILIDEKGVVRAEGFNIEQLDEKLQAKSFDLSLEDEEVIQNPEGQTNIEYRGFVRDEKGKPIEGAKVCWFSEQSGGLSLNLSEQWNHPDVLTTDKRGEFMLRNVYGDKIGIYVKAEGYAQCIIGPLVLPGDSKKLMQIVLQPGADVFGRVILEDGQNVVGARVSAAIFSAQLHKMLSSPWPCLATKTDENGFYRLVDLPAGQLSIGVNSAIAKGNLNMAQKKINLEPGDRTELNFGDEEGFTLTGVVRVGEKAVEIASVQIRLPHESFKYGQTDHNGNFRITGIPSGRYVLSTTYDERIDPKTFTWRQVGKQYYDNRQITINNDLSIEIVLEDRSKKKEEHPNKIMETSYDSMPTPPVDTSDNVNNERRVCESVENFIAAVLAGENVKATRFIYPGKAVAEQTDGLREILETKELRIAEVCAGNASALAISSAIQGDHGRAGSLIFNIAKVTVNQIVYWLIDDIDLETPKKVEQRLADFLSKNPDARTVIIKPRRPAVNPDISASIIPSTSALVENPQIPTEGKARIHLDCVVLEVSPALKMDKEIANMLGDFPTIFDPPMYMSSADLLLGEAASDKRTPQERIGVLIEKLMAGGRAKMRMHPILQLAEGQTHKFETAGNLLQVTPSIVKDGYIDMQLEATFHSKLIQEHRRQNPVTSKRSSTDTVRNRSGEILIIGSTIQIEEGREGDNNATNSEKKTTDLVFILTPTIVDTDNEPQNEINEPIETRQEQRSRDNLPAEESTANNSRVPMLAKSAASSGVDKSIVKVELSVVEVFSDSKMDRETAVLIDNLLGGKIALSDSPAAADLLRKAAEATASVKDESAGDKRVTQQQFNKLFDTLVSRGFVKILMRPTLEVVELQTAQIKTDQNSLEVTANAVKDDIIYLTVKADLNSKLVPEGVGQKPMTSTRSFASMVSISSGQSQIIGGMIQPAARPDTDGTAKVSQTPSRELMCIVSASIKAPAANEVRQKNQSTISGRCRDSGGRPLSNAQVLAFCRNYQQASLIQVAQSKTDSEGRFTLGPITPLSEEDRDRKSYFVFVPAEDHGPAWKTVNLYKPNNEPLELTSYNSAVVSGSILTEDSEPVAGAKVWVLGIISPEATEDPASRANDLHTTAALPGWSATTKQDGSFSIAGVPDRARIQLFISHRDFAGSIVHVKPGFDTSIKVQPAAAIKGRVLYGKSGKPAAGVIVRAQGVDNPIKGQNFSSWAQTTTDEQGRYRLESLFGTKYNIWAKAENLTVVALDSFQARVGETIEAPDLLLIEGGFIAGRVIDEATGKPVRPGQYSTVGIYGPSSPESFIAVEWSRVRKDGSFRIRVAPGRNDIYLNPTEDWGSEKAVVITSKLWANVDSGQTEEVEFKIRKLSKEEMEAAAQYRQTKPIRMPIPVTLDELGQSAHRMKLLGLALALYGQYDSPLPETLLEIKTYVRDEQDFKWMLDNVEYFGQGKTTGQPNAAQTPIAYDRTMLEEGIETNVMFLDFSVRMLDRKGLNELGVSKMMNAEEHADKLPDTQIARDGPVPVAAKDTNILPNDGRVEFVKPEILKDRDTGKTQFMFDIKVLTVSDEFMKYIGLDPNSVASSEGWSDYLVHSTDDSASFVVDQLHEDLLLRVIAARMPTHKDIQMLHKPQVLAMAGKKCEIHILESEYYILAPSSEPNALSGESESKINRIELGTTVRLTPNLTPDRKNVELDFEWEYRRLRGFKEQTGRDGKVQKFPIVDVDRIKTPCTVPDGKTLLITGKKIIELKKEPKKPRLSDLPLIGGLFSSTTKTEETRNLLILIKPIINPFIKAPPKSQPIDPNDPLIIKLEEKFKRSAEPK